MSPLPAILKWEKTKNAITGMTWTKEKDIRLFALNALNPRAQQFMTAYERPAEVAEEKAKRLKRKRHIDGMGPSL